MIAEPDSDLSLLLMVSSPNATASHQAQLRQVINQQPPTIEQWERIYQLAVKHRVVPFLYQSLRSVPAIPEFFLTTLQEECRSIAVDNLLKLREYHQLAGQLSQAGIAHVAFKGIYLAERSYPHSSLRRIGDLDLLIERSSLPKAITLFQTAGYTLGQAYQHYWGANQRHLLTDLHEVSLFKPVSSTSWFDIDLHWEVNCLFKELRSLYLDDLLLPPNRLIENQVVLLVIHHGVLNLWQRIGYVNDLYFLLKSGTVDWSWLLEKIKHYQLELIFLVGVRWCQQRGDFPLPSFIEQRLAQPQLFRLAQEYERAWTQVALLPATNTGYRQVRLFASTQARWQDRVPIVWAYVRQFLFRPSLITLGGQRFYLSRKWGIITALGRAVRFVYRFLRSRL